MTLNPAKYIYFLFGIIIIWAILYYAPGWGFMDDYGNIQIAKRFWEKGASFASLGNLIDGDKGVGRFRPIYQVWMVTVYYVFAQNPTWLYVFISLLCLSILPVWGLIIERIFHGEHQKSTFAVYVYPLSFFIFTPFWNNFMYVSILEKFVYLFSGPAIYFFLRGYDKQRLIDIVFAILFALLATLGKETGISLLMAFSAYAFLDILFLRQNVKLSSAIFGISAIISASYYVFIKSMLKNYTASYQSNFNFETMVSKLWQAPFVVKALFIMCMVWMIGFLIFKIFNKTSNASSHMLIIPLFLSFYLLVLAPWKFVNYLLAPLAPMVMAMLYPGYLVLAKGPMFVKRATQVAVIALAFLMIYGIIMPRISKMADKQKIAAHIETMKTEDATAQYYFPAPFMESADMLGNFAGVEIDYLADSRLSQNQLGSKVNHYLIVGDQEGAVELIDVGVDKLVYQNNTWRIFQLKLDAGQVRNFKVDFPRNGIQKLKDKIKRL